jgi:N-ethylmaleimide reductase
MRLACVFNLISRSKRFDSMAQKLFSEAKLGNLTLQNRIVMAPMTRARALSQGVPSDIVATYYAQRATAGLIITEGTSPSPNGLGYARIPGLYSPEQIAGWKTVTDAVHEKGGKIFAQLMHTGRVSHPANLPAGTEMVAPSAIAAKGDMWTDAQGMQPQPTPRELTTEEVKETIQEYIQAAKNAVEAGFDGVELHGANGYLIEQFLHPSANQRTDEYGGSDENRSRFLLEVAQGAVDAIGGDKVGVRLSPYGVAGDLSNYDGIETFYNQLAEQLHAIGLVYVHLVDHAGMGAPPVPPSVVDGIRERFKGTLILSGSYDAARAEEVLESGLADLVAFGRPFIANPDLVERLKTGAELAQPDPATFYAPGPNGFEQGFIDYPVLEEANA